MATKTFLSPDITGTDDLLRTANAPNASPRQHWATANHNATAMSDDQESHGDSSAHGCLVTDAANTTLCIRGVRGLWAMRSPTDFTSAPFGPRQKSTLSASRNRRPQRPMFFLIIIASRQHQLRTACLRLLWAPALLRPRPMVDSVRWCMKPAGMFFLRFTTQLTKTNATTSADPGSTLLRLPLHSTEMLQRPASVVSQRPRAQ